MWYTLRADPGARIAVGFQQPIRREELIPAAQSGKIMAMLNWIEVQPDETYLVPAGTVHAIGEGLALCEIQQNSDVTYRLFDYGRERELHLQQALEVSKRGCHPGKSVPREVAEGVQLVAECRWFQTYRLDVNRAAILAPQLNGRFLVVLEGRGLLNGVGAIPGYVFDLKSEPGGSASGCNEYFIEPEKSANSGSMKLLLIV
jgi:mannose-6-phosphate isomerase